MLITMSGPLKTALMVIEATFKLLFYRGLKRKPHNSYAVMNITEFRPSTSPSPSALQRAMDKLGEEMGIDASSRLALGKAALSGFDAEKVETLHGMGLKDADLSWIIKTRTLAHRKQKGERLTPEETGRLIRAAKTLLFALEVFGDNERALRWLHKPNPNFDGLSALELIRTEEGGALVLETLDQIDSGFAA